MRPRDVRWPAHSDRVFWCYRSARAVVAGTILGLQAAGGALAATPLPAPPQVDAKSFILIDQHSDQVLAAQNENLRVEPASITKLMTGLIVFEELAANNIGLEDQVTVSEAAWRMPGSRTFIEVGSQVRVEDLLRGMIVQSGNDASVSLAEHVAGSEETFADMMNQYAARLGMTDTHFQNSTGLPGPEHYTTARDIATLSRVIIRDYPDYYRWYAEREFTFNGITQHNRNALLWKDSSIDGLKTGHTDSAGYCLAASAARDGMRLISVVMGSASDKSRMAATVALLNYGFRFYETHKLYSAGEPITRPKIWKGTAEQAALGLDADLYLTIPRGRYEELEASLELPPALLAPLDAGQGVGSVRIALDDEIVAERPLRALAAVDAGGLWRRTVDTVRLWFE